MRFQGISSYQDTHGAASSAGVVNRSGRQPCDTNDDNLFGANVGLNSKHAFSIDNGSGGGLGEDSGHRNILFPANENSRELSDQTGQFCSLPSDVLFDGTFVFFNSEGKFKDVDQMGTTIRDIDFHTGSKWVAIIVAEADWLASTESWEETVLGHTVVRQPMEGGRAMKVVLHRVFGAAKRNLVWRHRACRLDFVFKVAEAYRNISFLGAHFAHGEGWDSSYDEFSELICSSPSGARLYVAADFNVEFRAGKQSQLDLQRSTLIRTTMQGINLDFGFEPGLDTVTRRPSGLLSFLDQPSLIDMFFVPSSGNSCSWISWDSAPGDHCVLFARMNEHVSTQSQHFKGGQWRCLDEDSFQADVANSAPQRFCDLAHFTSFMSSLCRKWTDPRSAKQRRRDWEPESVKALRRQLRLATDLQSQGNLRKKLYHLRVHIAKQRRLTQSAAEIKSGRVKLRQPSKLFKLEKMLVDRSVTTEPSFWVDALGHDFKHRWTQANAEDLDTFAALGGYEPYEVVIEPSEILSACSTCKKQNRLDSDGICVRAIRLSSSVHFQLADLISRSLSSDDVLERLSLTCFVKGKARGSVTPDQTRGLIPQLSFLYVCHNVLLNRINPKLDLWASEQGVGGLVLGCGKGGQTMDINFSMCQLLEKARDRFNSGAICQGDILKCNDFIPWGGALKSLLRRGIEVAIAVALIRLHRCPQVCLMVGDCLSNVVIRNRGGLTGSSSASAMARVCIEDAFVMAQPSLVGSFQVCQNISLPFMAWSDNLYVTGDKIENAVSNFESVSFYLESEFGFKIKSDSRIVIPARTKKFDEHTLTVHGTPWQCVDTCKSLGNFLTSTGESNSECSAMFSAWSRAFWSNCKVFTNRRAPPASRMKLWKRLCYSLADHRLPLISPAVKTAEAIEASCNKFAKFIAGVRRLETDDARSFVTRRNSVVASLKRDCSFDIRSRWAIRIVSWVEHMFRHQDRPSFHFLNSQTDPWLRARRREAGLSGLSRTLRGGATNTRCGPGAPLRWGNIWFEYILFTETGWHNPTKDKSQTRLNADLLLENFLVRGPSSLVSHDA